MLKVLNDLLIAVDRGEAVVLALLDQSAAFDTIDHAILLYHLTARFGITGCVLAWFESYLYNRRQSVSVKGKSSRSVFLPFGVPQGSVLGPILNTLYNSPLHDIAYSHGISDHYYADDEQLYCSFRPTTEGGEQRLAFSALACRKVQKIGLRTIVLSSMTIRRMRWSYLRRSLERTAQRRLIHSLCH